MDPLMVAPFPMVVFVVVPDNSVGADGEEDPHAPEPMAVPISARRTITFLKFTVSASGLSNGEGVE
jgi:hypothetical protein